MIDPDRRDVSYHLSCNAYLRESALVLKEFIAEHALDARIILRPLPLNRTQFATQGRESLIPSKIIYTLFHAITLTYNN